ncbi:MAG: LacI family DNA-binding transcriptional regulator [Rhodobacteraceae bacterium]|nr:LacI family DNA-binding transcriptional regulator [Paracoccaceae bacterium]
MQNAREAPGNKHATGRVTIIDLAEHLGLAKGTVSRALNGYPDISDGTRLRVRNAADQLGYRPLSHAQAIRTGRVRSVGLVLQMNEHDGHRPFVADFLAGVSAAASAEDWSLTVATASSDAETLKLLDRLAQEKKADGFILPRTRLDDPRVNRLRETGTPFVLYGRTDDLTGCAWYDIESEAAMAQAVAHLVAQGHTRIGFVPGAEGYTYSKLRLEGYLAGLTGAGIAFDPELIAASAVAREDGAAAVGVLLDLPNPPTAILCSVDAAAAGTYDAARRRGLKVGSDLSVISYDGAPESQYLDPPLSTFTVDVRAAGERLANMLIRQCRGEDPETLRALAQATFRKGGSDGPAPHAA